MNTLSSSVNKFPVLLRSAIVFAPLVLLVLAWLSSFVQTDNFIFSVDQVYLFSFLETKWLYSYLHIFTFVPVFCLSFDRRVAFYKNWKSLFPAITIVAVFFIIWDVLFTRMGVWGFNPDYISGISFFHLPFEEILFFFTVPFACTFIYECLNYYFPKDYLASMEAYLTPVLILIFLSIGTIYYTNLYTTTTFLLSGFVLLAHYLYGEATFRKRFYLAYLVSWIPFMLVNGALTGSYTNAPVVVYNPAEYLGVRLTSVPLDDSIYSFAMLFTVIWLYERFKSAKK